VSARRTKPRHRGISNTQVMGVSRNEDADHHAGSADLLAFSKS
jgi:hypothetical protein